MKRMIRRAGIATTSKARSSTSAPEGPPFFLLERLVTAGLGREAALARIALMRPGQEAPPPAAPAPGAWSTAAFTGLTAH
jgi:hypothetical protein